MKKRKLKRKDFGYYLFKVLRYPVLWVIHSKLNLNLIKNEAKDDEGPFFITGNHVTAYDPIIALIYVKPLIRFVAADANLENWFKTFIFKLARVVPIAKRFNDISVIKRLLAEVKSGNSVGLYPEGGRNWYGETDEIIESTAKLIKLLGIKVYCQKLEGAYMTSPRWGKTLRKGKTNVTIYEMLSAEEIKTMSDKEILKTLKKHLYHNDYEFQREEMELLNGKDHAEYIERAIYYCPNCQHFHTFKSHKDDFSCKNCGAKGRVNRYGFIEGDFPYDNLVDWYHEQKEQLTDELNNHPIKPIEIYDVHHKIDINGKKEKCLVNLLIEQDKITIYYENQHKEILYQDISAPSITFKNTLIFFEKKNRYEFVIEPFLHNNTSILYIKEIISFLRGNKNA